MDLTEVLTSIDTITGLVGSDEDGSIETVITTLAEIKEKVSTVNDTMQALNDDVERLNKRNKELQTSNNQIMRQLHVQQEVVDNAQKEVTRATEISELF